MMVTLRNPTLTGLERAPRRGDSLLLVTADGSLVPRLELDTISSRLHLKLELTGSVSTAFCRLADELPTLVMVDLALGGEASIELIGAASGLEEVAVVALTNAAGGAQGAAALQAGAVECVEISTDPISLEQRLLKVLERDRLARDAEYWRERYRNLYEICPTGLFRLAVNGTVIDANPAMARVLGYDAVKELVGKPLFEFASALGETRPLDRTGNERPYWSREVCLRRRDGSRLWGWINDQKQRDPDSGEYWFEGSFVDASREYALSDELTRREALYVELFGSMAEPTLLLDLEGVVLACNRQGEKLLGRRSLDIVGRPVSESVAAFVAADGQPIEVGEGASDPLVEAALASRPRHMGFLCHDDRTVWVTVHARPIPVPQTAGRNQFLVSLIDGTEMRELHLRAQRGEVDSLVAGGAAHDARNLLTAIHAAADLIGRAGGADEQAMQYAEQIRGAAKRASDLVSRFLDYSRPRQSRREVFEVDHVLKTARPLIQAALKRSAELKLDLQADDTPLVGDAVELERAVFNLVLNARDALNGNGVIEIVTRRERSSGVEDQVSEPVSDWVTISVVDNGCGMSDEVRERALEPYYSAKVSGGTGLGLVNVSRWVRSMRGRIQIESARGEGTRVEIGLPLGQPPAS